MSIYWLEQSAGDLPTGNDWLSPFEVSAMCRFRFSKRRDEWRLGRWTAKLCIATYLEIPPAVENLRRVEIRSASSGAPTVFIEEQTSSLVISLSHRAGKAMCVVSTTPAAIGCDLELVEPRGPEFLTDYFTSDEQALVRETSPEKQPLIVTFLWSGKESALKAMHLGLSVDTRSVTLCPLMNDDHRCDESRPIGLAVSNAWSSESLGMKWQPFRMHSLSDQEFGGWWGVSDSLVRTIVIAAA